MQGRPEKMAKDKQIATQEDLKCYFENFTSKHRIILRPDINYFADAIVSTKDGSLIFIEFKEGKGVFKYELTDEPIGNVIMRLPQRAFGGNLSNVKFGGVNIIREGNKLIIIKGDNSPKAWSEEEALNDALKEIKSIRNLLAHGRTKSNGTGNKEPNKRD
jgi:hypothetical protein